LRVRPATRDDIPYILRLEQQSPNAAHWTEQQYRQAFEREGPERLVLVAEAPLESVPETNDDPRSVRMGFLVARHLAPEWELENIVVAESDRRKGTGKRLLDSLLAAARETNSEALLLEVRESNAAAVAFYEKAGFERAGRRKSYYVNPMEDAVLYRYRVL